MSFVCSVFLQRTSRNAAIQLIFLVVFECCISECNVWRCRVRCESILLWRNCTFHGKKKCSHLHLLPNRLTCPVLPFASWKPRSRLCCFTTHVFVLITRCFGCSLIFCACDHGFGGFFDRRSLTSQSILALDRWKSPQGRCLLVMHEFYPLIV